MTQNVASYPNAGVRSLFIFSLPLILTFLSQSLMLFGDRLLLSHYSINALEICSASQALCILFQLPCIRISSIAQVFVAQNFGGSKLAQIGPVVWQMIWFSILSIFIVVPLGLWLETFFFTNSSLPEGVSYFRLLLWMNFLFPLSSALVSFFLGIGQNRIVIYAQLSIHVIHLLLDYLLIYGVQGVFEPLGFMGAAYATVFSQSLLCSILFIVFVQQKNRRVYCTNQFHFQRKAFLESFRVGLPKALARFCVLAVWTCNMHVMMTKGEAYLAIISFGSTLVGTFTFITEGMSQGLITLASIYIGAKKWKEVWRLYRSSFLFSIGTIALLTLPLIFFSDLTVSLFFNANATSEASFLLLRKTCFWVWLLLIGNAVNFIGVSFLSASKDTTFHMLANLLSWVVCYLPVYVGIGYFSWQPDRFWIILALEPLIIASIFHWRLGQEKWKRSEEIKILELA